MKGIIFLLIILFFNPAYSDCGYSIGAASLDYTVTDNNSSTPFSFAISRNNQGGGACDNLQVGFSSGNCSNYNRQAAHTINGSKLLYNLYGSSNSVNILKSIKDADSSNQLLSGVLAKNQTKTFTYYFSLAAFGSSTLPSAGIYTDNIQIQVAKKGTGNKEDAEVFKNLAVKIIIPKSISISIVDSGGSFNNSSTNKILDFGELSLGQELGIDLKVLTNAGLRLSVSSANNQLMQLMGANKSLENQIGYDFYFGGIAKNLSNSNSNPVILTQANGATSPGGNTYPLKIIIKSVENKTFGTYQDYLTFTVATTE